jgi:hypothetical protein
MPERDDEPFIGRWSRLKQQARRGEAPEAGCTEAAAAGMHQPAPVPAKQPAVEAEKGAIPEREACEPPSADTDFSDFDFSTLDAGSDYTRFMGDKVPNAIRQKALARLWTSDPVFAGLDPLHDYHGDFTDAAVAVKEGLATAYRVGRGFLSDEEVAAWERLGRPEVPDEGPGEAAEVAEAGAAQPAPGEPAQAAEVPSAGASTPDDAGAVASSDATGRQKDEGGSSDKDKA